MKSTENTNDIQIQKKYKDKVIELVSGMSKSLSRPLYVYVQTFGCQQNEADSERIIGSALALGYQKADRLENADLIIFNTCAVREHAELRALSKTGQLKHLKEKNKALLIGLWGCMVSQEHRKEDIKMKYPYVDFIAGTNMLHRLPEILCDVMVTKRRRFYIEDVEKSEIIEGVEVSRESDIKAWISIMYGCDNFCTYCVVPHVRGRERSRTPDAILSEVSEVVGKGCKEITLLGQNVNSYGKGLPEGQKITFAELLNRICSIPGDFWVRFMTSHPKDVSDELIETIAKNPKIAHHFHLPMQAGNDEILKKMNRKYTSDQFLSLAEKLKAAVPDMVLTSDIICGFPSETEEAFNDTLKMVEKVGFDSVFAFIYSPRKGTAAADMPDLVSHKEKTERFARLAELQAKITARINQDYLGKTFKVLCETHKEDAKDYYTGRTSGNKVILFKANDISEDIYGSFVTVRVTETKAAQIFGELVLIK